MQVERFILEQVLPYYANSHTEASYCGGFITRLRREARATIARCCGADEAHAVIFAGSARRPASTGWSIFSACARPSRRADRSA